MRAFRVSGFAAVALALAISWAGPSLGQTEGPATAPPRALPGDPGEPEQTAAPAAEPAGPPGIAVTALGSYEGPSAGLLDDTNGGLGADIWGGTSRAEAISLIEAMPAATTVPSMRDLARRVLETRAAAPAGAAERSFEAVRLRKLLDAGFVEDAGILAANMQVPDDPAFARVQADAILFAGHANDACGPLTQTRMDSADPFWIELRAYCYAVSGDGAALGLTKAVMQEQGIDDEAFGVLLDGIQSGEKVGPGNIDQPTALHVFLMGQIGDPIPRALAVQLDLPGDMAVLRDPANSQDDKMAAAQDAVSAGALPQQTLEALADGMTFADSQLANAETVAPTLPFLTGQALLRQAAMKAPDNDGKARLAAAALTLGAQHRLRPVAAELQASIVAGIAPDPKIADLAAPFCHALLLARDAAAARRWCALPDSADPLAFDIRLAESNVLSPVSDPAGSKAVSDALDELAGEIAPQAPGGNDAERETAALIVAVYDALGAPMSPVAQAAIVGFAAQPWPGREIAPALLARAEAAATDPTRKGEAIAALLAGIGAGGPADLSPGTIAKAVRILAETGEAKAARDFAVDALALYRPAPMPPPPTAAPVPPQ